MNIADSTFIKQAPGRLLYTIVFLLRETYTASHACEIDSISYVTDFLVESGGTLFYLKSFLPPYRPIMTSVDIPRTFGALLIGGLFATVYVHSFVVLSK